MGAVLIFGRWVTTVFLVVVGVGLLVLDYAEFLNLSPCGTPTMMQALTVVTNGTIVTATSTSGQPGQTCEVLDFPKRTAEEESAFVSRWDSALAFVKDRSLTFMDDKTVQMHRDFLMEIEREGIPGIVVECGVAKAGSSITFAAVKNPNRCFHLFDTFEGMPKPSDKDGPDVHRRYAAIQKAKKECQEGGKCDKSYYGNMDDLMGYDMQQFRDAGLAPEEYNVHFHKGLFDDTVFPHVPVAYAHLDGDWYESVMHMLQRISPFLADGGYFVLDDVFHYSGATKAFKEYFDVDVNWLVNKKAGGAGKCLTTVAGRQYILGYAGRVYAQPVTPEQATASSGVLPKCV